MAKRLATLTGILTVAALLAGCGGSTGSSDSTTSAPASPSSSQPMHGTANVAYAGSLTGLMQTTLQPGYEEATGNQFVGKAAGSTALAQSILNGEIDPGVFVSVGTKAIKLLWPSRAKFAMSLGTDPLVVAYSSKSRYASQLNAIRTGQKPLSDLFSLMETPGFKLGRTDPNLDPQGGYFVGMVDLAEKQLNLPAGTADKILGTSSSNAIGSSSQIVDETALPTDIASGIVDAGSSYITEAKQFHLEYIRLPAGLNFSDPAHLPTYETVSIPLTGGVTFQGGLITLNQTMVLPPHGQTRPAADVAADTEFMAYLLSPKGQTELKDAGYVISAPVLHLAPGSTSASAVLPASVLSSYDRLGGSISTS